VQKIPEGYYLSLGRFFNDFAIYNHYCSGKMAISVNRFFATLRFAQNDNYLDIKGKGVESGSATFNPLTLPNTITCCHSERSEESLISLGQ
jgi:hypothetical protein